MTSILKLATIVIYLSIPLLLNSCTRPGDKSIKPLTQTVPLTDSTNVLTPLYRPKKFTVEISEMKFRPDTITVHKGDTITWKNNDLVTHCVTEITTNAWTSSKIPAGESWKMVADASSDYFCAIHMVMKGKIIVE